MRKKFLGRLLSLTLSATLALSSFTTPVYAAESQDAAVEAADEASWEGALDESEDAAGEGADARDAADPKANEGALETPSDDTDISEEEFDASDDLTAEEDIEDAAGEATSEVEAPVQGEDAAEVSEDGTISGSVNAATDSVAVNFHSNYNGKDKVVKKSYSKNDTSTEAIKASAIFAASDIGAEDKFEGWALGDSIRDSLSAGDIVTYAKENSLASVDAYAQWASIGTYTVTFEPNAPSEIAAELISPQSSWTDTYDISEPFVLSGTEFNCSGYELVGWKYTDSNGKTGTIKTPAATLKSLCDKDGGSVTVSAQWKQMTYTLTFNANGGKFVKGFNPKIVYKLDATTKNRIAFPGYKLSDDGTPVRDSSQVVATRPGYTFVGWQETSDSGAYYGERTFRSFNFHVRWSANHVTATFDPNGGEIDHYDEETGDWTESSTEPYIDDTYYSSSYWGKAFQPRRDGYTFKGWRVSVKGKSKVLPLEKYNPVKDIDGALEGKITLTAEWAQETNKLKVDLAGGKAGKLPATYKTGSGLVIPTPTRDGYEFDGWTIYKNGYETAEEFILTEDNKIRDDVYGDLEFYANWKELDFTLKFLSNDGKVTYETTEHYLTYNRSIDFAVYAATIEGESGFDNEAYSIKGFATTPNSSKITYELNKKYTKVAGKAPNADGSDIVLSLYAVVQPKVYRIFYDADNGTVSGATYTYTKLTKDLAIKAKATMTGSTFLGWITESESDIIKWDSEHKFVTGIKAGAAEDVFLTAVYSAPNKYTVTLVPNASGVKDDKGNAIPETGVDFVTAEGQKEFAFYDVADLPNYEWTREGYTFMGFATTAKGKEAIGTVTQLGNGKTSNVKLYGIWQADTYHIQLWDNCSVFRDGEEYTDGIYPYFELKTFSVEQTYGKKAVTLPKVTATGFTFLGWTFASDIPADARVVYTDASKKIFKAIAGDNSASFTIKPAFAENSYNLYADANGGKYNGKSGKQLLAKVYYTDDVTGYIEDVYQHSVKSGSQLSDVALDKAGKNYLRYTYTNSDGQREIRYRYNYGMSTKNGASVVIYAVYYKINASSYTNKVYRANLNGTQLTMQSYWYYTNTNYVIQFEYSTNAFFLFNRHRAQVAGKGTVTETVPAGKNYYVRVRTGIKDSTGEFVYGPWSSPAKASTSGE
jgi:uncharacterized repeat protein (TIGR02543 family)